MKLPSHLGKDGRELWSQLVSEYGITDAAGLTLVTTIAECKDRLTEAQVLIKRHGAVIAAPTGHLRSNPAIRVEVDARNGMLAALRMLNLDIEPLRDLPGRPAGSFLTGDRGKKRLAQ